MLLATLFSAPRRRALDSVPLHDWSAKVLTALTALLISGLFSVLGADLNLDSLVLHDVGGSSLAGSMTNRAGVVQITSGGRGIGMTSDQFDFAVVPEPGDFDVQVRVSSLKNTDLWAKAGLMLRESLEAGARFAAVFSTPSGAGCLFQTRDVVGGTAGNQGAFPANQPFAWLRLRREGGTLSGYAGYDGRRWTLLGTKEMSFGPDALFGLAVASHAADATIAEFQDLGLAANAVIAPVPVPIEPLGPSTRRSALVISEIMYHPIDRADGKDLEFIELYNAQPYFEDISGWRLAGDIQFTFPEGTMIPGGAFLVVAKAPADLRQVYGLEGVFGPFTGRLSNSGGNLRLVGEHDAVFLSIDFNDAAPWPELPDGTGHSLALLRPSYGETNPRAWGSSRVIGGSPGLLEAVELSALSDVRINECQIADSTGAGFVELFNAGTQPADLGGLRLGAEPDRLPFVIPAGIQLKGGEFVSFTWAQLGFRLENTGETLYLQSADASRFIDAVTFRPQMTGASAGRWPNGGEALHPFAQATPGAPNAYPRADIVINEIHHSPISGDGDEEFVEIYNSSKSAVDLSSWEFTTGLTFKFPPGTTIPADGYLVIARNPARLKQLYPKLDPGLILGGFEGKLDGRGEDLVLSRPIATVGNNEIVLAPVALAAYAGSGRWHQASGEGGSTLELTDPRANTSLSANWAESDESSRGEWTTVEFTGVLDNGPTGGGGRGGGGRGGGPGGGGTLAPDSLHIILLGEGECLVDNVEVIGPGNTNRIANGKFDLEDLGWTFAGNHVRSSIETDPAGESGQVLHLRASGNGDTGANKIFVRLTQPLANGNTATLRARVKWLRGWPEILLRLRGNYLEAFGRLEIRGGPGTPGAKNSRAMANAGPAIGQVTHFPAVPAAHEPVVVTAHIDDPDGIRSAVLRYRVDPDATLTSVDLSDTGTGGDGIPGDGVFSATIPPPGSAKLVAFTIEATDGAGSPATRLFPPSAPKSECLVRFGDGFQSGAFGTYRLWVSQSNSEAWRNRPVMSNEPIESTFVYGNSRIVYGTGSRFAGSPYHQQFPNGPASDAHFVVEFPKDDRVLGAAGFNKLHAPGNGAFDDNTLQREQVVYWFARKMGIPWLHRRFFHFYVNGVKKRTLMEDTQVGSDDLIEQFWPQDPDGPLYKMQPWFEFADGTSQMLQMQSSTFVSINRFTTTGNQLKLARYRWNWLVRGADGTANDYADVLNFINVATAWTNSNYHATVESLVNLDEWFRFFAIHHAVGNWDSVGYRNQQNTYAYKPLNGRWELIIWDANIVLGNGSDGPTNLPLFTTTDPTLTRWFNQDPFYRRRFLLAYDQLANGPMQANAIGPVLDAKYAAFQEHGVNATSPAATKTWINAARGFILAEVQANSADFEVSDVSGADPLTLRGTGPLNMGAVQINGIPVAVTWTTTKTWTASIAALPGPLTLSALDTTGRVIPGTQQTVTFGPPPALILRQENGELLFEYPVASPGTYRLEGSNSLFPAAWQIVATQASNGSTVQFRIPVSSAAQMFYRVQQEQTAGPGR